MKSNIYQLIAFVNGYNRKTRNWDSLHSVSNVYYSKEGLKTAYIEFKEQQKEVQTYFEVTAKNYFEIRGKVELQIPHIHENGKLAYWGSTILETYNPQNI